VLALGTVAVATGVVAVTDFTAGRAGKDLSSQRLGTAALDGAHRLAMARQQVCGIFLAVGGTVLAEEISQF